MLAALKAGVKAPYVAGYVSTLGGRPSVMLTFSLDPRESWANSILQNSRYAQMSVHYPDRKIEHFSGWRLGKFRKAAFKSPADAVAKLNKWIAQAR